jgi:hypothetical protein
MTRSENGTAKTSYWILGGGKFGQKAAARLSGGTPNADITIVDKAPSQVEVLSQKPVKVVCMDGIQFLAQHLTPMTCPDWIIPAIPVHVAFEWMRTQVSPETEMRVISVPEALRERLPNPLQGAAGEIYMSNADFICPDRCEEPDDICLHTGEPRPRCLHEYLKRISGKTVESHVIISHQLAPGVGGIRPHDLFAVLEAIPQHSGVKLLSTACKCHGVMHAFRIEA